MLKRVREQFARPGAGLDSADHAWIDAMDLHQLARNKFLFVNPDGLGLGTTCLLTRLLLQ
jgi:hypothetical protein